MMTKRFWTCPFPYAYAACNAYCASKWAATSCPGILDAGFVCQNYTNCTLCQQGVLEDEKHPASKCPALQDLRDRYENLFQAPQGDAMIHFMWQDCIIGVARFIDACLERVYTSDGPPVRGDQAYDQP